MLHAHRIEVKTDREDNKQKKLTDIFLVSNGKKTALVSSANSKDERFILGRRLVLWLCKDLLPFKCIENKGFQDFWTSFGFDVTLPTRQTVSISALDDMYKCLKNELLIKMSAGNMGMYFLFMLKLKHIDGIHLLNLLIIPNVLNLY